MAPKAQPEPTPEVTLGYLQEEGKGRAYARACRILTLALNSLYNQGVFCRTQYPAQHSYCYQHYETHY
jgi:hypothetical protein